MPTSSTLAWTAWQALTMRTKLSSVVRKEKPRKASLPPNSITTSLGLCCFKIESSRAKPPAVVSPLMLAFITCQGLLSLLSCAASNATQPVPRAIPYSALKESPKIKMVG